MAKARDVAPADPGGKPPRRRRASAAPGEEVADDLSYNEARTALELTLAELQASDVDVEAMGALYRRAEAYANRCEALLQQVEQEVALWNVDAPDDGPTPYAP